MLAVIPDNGLCLLRAGKVHLKKGKARQLRVCVLIPSYNESKTIGSLVKAVKAKGLDVVVVDDGSIDQTQEIARQSGAYVLRNEKNRGKGASLREGFRYVLNKGFDAVITMDGDGQHSLEDISSFLNAASEPSVEMIVGNRMSSKQNMPRLRWLTNSFMSWLISLICRQDIPDSQCGFRLIKRKVIKELNPISANYEIESEILIEAQHKGFRIKFIPVQTIYAKQASQINPVVDTIRFFRYILKIFCPFFFNK